MIFSAKIIINIECLPERRTKESPPAFVALGKLALAMCAEESLMIKELKDKTPELVDLVMLGLVKPKPDALWRNR